MCIPLRGLCVDIPNERFIFFWIPLGIEQFLIPALCFVGFSLAILLLSHKKGRVFCAWFCPMHWYLEMINCSRKGQRSSLKTLLLSLLGAVVATEILMSFLWPMSQQLAFVRNPATRMLTLAIGVTTAGLFFALFFHFRERFSIHACPYGLIQLVIQSPATQHMQFKDTKNTCIQCGSCDNLCPMNLDAKQECDSLRCTSCGLCEEACVSVLGPDLGLFKLSQPGGGEA